MCVSDDLVRVCVREFVLIVALIFSDLKSICYCRFGSQELVKVTDSGTRAAGSGKVIQ